MRQIIFIAILLISQTASSHKNYKLTSPRTHNSGVTIAKVSAPDDTNILSLNSEQSFTPASCLKTITTLFLIKELGKDFRYSTKLEKLEDNTYVIRFSGDYMLKTKDIAKLLSPIKGEKIHGKFILDISEYQNTEWSPNVMMDITQGNDHAPMLAAIIDDNQHFIEITPTKKGSLASVKVSDNEKYASTVITSDKTHIWLERRLGGVLVNGTIAEDSKTITKRIAAYSGQEFIKNKIEQILKNNKIGFSGGIEFLTEKDTDLGKSELIAEHKSDKLENFIKKALKISDDIAFDSLYLKIVNRNFPFPKWENGDALVKKFLMDEYKIDAKEALFADGSGISRYNRIKPSLLLKVLKAAYGNELFKSSLATSEEKDSSLSSRKLPSVLKAKTGTLSGISCLCGYLDYPNEPLAFVMMTNNFIPPAVGIRKMEDELLNEFDSSL